MDTILRNTCQFVNLSGPPASVRHVSPLFFAQFHTPPDRRKGPPRRAGPKRIKHRPTPLERNSRPPAQPISRRGRLQAGSTTPPLPQGPEGNTNRTAPRPTTLWTANARHLLQIIDDVLDLSKIEAGKIAVARESCSPCKIIAEVASLMRTRAAAKGLTEVRQ
jgi:hypothetical protein